MYGARLEFNWDGENVGKAFYGGFEILTEGSETILSMKQQLADHESRISTCELKWENINTTIDNEITAQTQEGGIIYNFVKEHGGGGSDRLLYEAAAIDSLTKKFYTKEGEQTLQQKLGSKLNQLDAENFPTTSITDTANLPSGFRFTGDNTLELMSIDTISTPITLEDGVSTWQTPLPSLVSVSLEATRTFPSPFINGPQTFAGALPNLKDGDTLFCSPNLVSFSTNLPSLENGHDMFASCEMLVSVDTELPLLKTALGMFQSTGIYSFDINLPSLQSGVRMFYNCKNLQSFTGNTPLLRNAESMFADCIEMREFKWMLPRLEQSTNMFKNCNLKEWKVSLPSLITADGMFTSNTSLTTFQLGTDKSHRSSMNALESANGMFQNCDLPTWKINMPALKEASAMFSGNKNLVAFQLGADEEYSNSMNSLTLGSEMFKNCNLTTWKIDMPVIENGDDMFNSNKNLTTFQLGNDSSFANEMPALTTAKRMFQNCNLTTWKIDMPVLKTADYMFYLDKDDETYRENNSLTEFQLGADKTKSDTFTYLESAIGMFMNCNLTSWNIELPALVNAGTATRNTKEAGMFYGNHLTSWNIELPLLKNGNAMFRNNDLREWKIDLPELQYGGSMFYGNKNLKSFSANTPKLEHARHYI